jgi:hypothetical protein
VQVRWECFPRVANIGVNTNVQCGHCRPRSTPDRAENRHSFTQKPVRQTQYFLMEDNSLYRTGPSVPRA